MKKKLGLTVEDITNERLSELAAMTGKTKGRIIDDAIEFFHVKQTVLNKRLAKMNDDLEADLDIDQILKERLKEEKKIKKMPIDENKVS